MKRTTRKSRQYIKAILNFNTKEIQKSIEYDEINKTTQEVMNDILPGASIFLSISTLLYDMFKPRTYRLRLSRH